MLTDITIDLSKCVCCGGLVDGRDDFSDAPSWREFFLSGFCQKCQDKVFALPGIKAIRGVEMKDEDYDV